MDGSVIIRPEDVEQFSRFLASFGDQLRSDMERIRAELSRLGETYRDESYHQFVQENDQAQQNIVLYLEQLDNFVRFLSQKAAAAEAVREIRL